MRLLNYLSMLNMASFKSNICDTIKYMSISYKIQ